MMPVWEPLDGEVWHGTMTSGALHCVWWNKVNTHLFFAKREEKFKKKLCLTAALFFVPFRSSKQIARLLYFEMPRARMRARVCVRAGARSYVCTCVVCRDLVHTTTIFVCAVHTKTKQQSANLNISIRKNWKTRGIESTLARCFQTRWPQCNTSG